MIKKPQIDNKSSVTSSRTIWGTSRSLWVLLATLRRRRGTEPTEEGEIFKVTPWETGKFFVGLCPPHLRYWKGNQKHMMVVFWPNDEWWFMKVDSSEGGVPCSSEPGGGGDESILAQFSEQVVAMSRSALLKSSSSDGLTLSFSTTTTCFSTLARTMI